jgi:hypothetical protein
MYGSIAKSRLGKGVVRTTELTQPIVSELSGAIAHFQISTLSESLKELAEADFVAPEQLVPTLLIAPYLYIEADNWETQTKKNIEFLNSFLGDNEVRSSGIPVYSEIVISKEVLKDRPVRKQIAEMYSVASAEGYILWIDDFAEFQESSHSLMAYVEFLSSLHPETKPIIALHGSYFSVLLASRKASKLAGVGHGIEYGEHRAVVPVGGGVPLAKYYFPRFHKRVDYYPDAQDVLLEMDCAKSEKSFLARICDCEICRELIVMGVAKGFEVFGETKPSPVNGRPYPTARAMMKSRMHYLNNKRDEYGQCQSSGLQLCLDKLQEVEHSASHMVSHDLSHIERWVETLKSL